MAEIVEDRIKAAFRNSEAVVDVNQVIGQH